MVCESEMVLAGIVFALLVVHHSQLHRQIRTGHASSASNIDTNVRQTDRADLGVKVRSQREKDALE